MFGSSVQPTDRLAACPGGELKATRNEDHCISGDLGTRSRLYYAVWAPSENPFASLMPFRTLWNAIKKPGSSGSFSVSCASVAFNEHLLMEATQATTC